MPDDPDPKEGAAKTKEPEKDRPDEPKPLAEDAKTAEDAKPLADESKPEGDAAKADEPSPKTREAKPIPVEARSYPEEERSLEPKAKADASEPEVIVAKKPDEPKPKTRQEEPTAAPPPGPPDAPPAAWGRPFAAVDRVWTKIEERLCATVLLAEVFVLVGWICIHGLSTPFVPGGPLGGVFFRCLFGAAVLGVIVHFILRPRKGQEKDAQRRRVHTYAVTAAVVAGGAIGPLWGNVGVAYAQNLQNWLDTSSVLFLLGGLGGLVKRLTIWLALLGASLATQSGKHIHFDLGIRRLAPASRMPVVVVGGLVGALVCFGASAGFYDEITVSHFNVISVMPCKDNPSKSCDKPLGDKIGEVTSKMGTDMFLLGRQISLDVKMLPRVLSGDSYKESLTGAEWNEWMKGASWESHFPKEAVEAQTVDPKAFQVPAIPYPGGPELPYELMLREANLIFPFGFLMIGLRLLLRVILVLARHIKIDPDAAHAEDDQVKHGEGAAKKEAT